MVAVNTLKLAKPDKAQYVESYVLQLASSGRMMGKMSEQELINVIEQVNRQTAPKKTKVNVSYSQFMIGVSYIFLSIFPSS